ncbi:MAG: sugar-binding protein [Armatimonadota bacterium]
MAFAEEKGIAPLLASHRMLPTAWRARGITSGLSCGPDGGIYFVAGAYPNARFICFDPAQQRFIHLADLGTLWSNTRAGRSVRVTAPIVFDRRGDAWLGTQSMPADAGGRSGRLLSYSLKDRAFGVIHELANRSIIALGSDPARDRLLALATGPDTRLMSFDIAAGAWKDHGPVATGYLRAPALVTLDDGSAVIIGEHNTLYRFDPQTETLAKSAAALPAGSGAWALAAAPDGSAVYGLMRTSELLFAYDVQADTARDLGRAFNGFAMRRNLQAEDETPEMAVFSGTDGKVYYTGYGSFLGVIGACDLKTGEHTLAGALSSSVRILAPSSMDNTCRGLDGRVYLAGSGSVGSGLYAFPPLPEEVPWSTTDRAYTCRHIADTDVQLDGDPSEPVWRRLPALDNLLNTFNAMPPKYKTVAWLAWSDTRLYVAYRCEIDAINAVGKARDSDVWRGECAELFLCPRGAEAPYYEIEFSPTNVLYDSRPLSYSWDESYTQTARNWNPDTNFKALVQRDADGKVTGWTLEAAIPFTAFDGGTPEAGAIWLFNAYRIAHPANGGEEYQAWQPTYADFHKPHQFPKLKFER